MNVKVGTTIAQLLASSQGKRPMDVVLEGFAILAAEIDALREEFESRPDQTQAQGSGQ